MKKVLFGLVSGAIILLLMMAGWGVMTAPSQAEAMERLQRGGFIQKR